MTPTESPTPQPSEVALPEAHRASESPRHLMRAGPNRYASDDVPDPARTRYQVEPWLAALLQAEHLNLLAGSGLTTAIGYKAGAPTVDMRAVPFACDYSEAVDAAATSGGSALGRGAPNLEDQIRAARELIAGLKVLSLAADAEGDDSESLVQQSVRLLASWSTALEERMKGFLESVLLAERAIRDALDAGDDRAHEVGRLLCSFLLTFSSRTATRERLHIFTTNYDRLLEYGCDLLGLRALDRFVGRLNPVFRASRLGIDLHYNPPGIRGEPRYLEGVVRLTKLHGSVDWRYDSTKARGSRIVCAPLPFGAPSDHPELPRQLVEGLLIYPNPAKDMETLEYPYAELFRDFAAATCQPNSVLVTYGYGFGDDHINRVIRDMLTIPSTHLAIISFDDASGRIPRFAADVARDEQVSLFIGSHFGDLTTLVHNYLPKPALDRNTWRMVELLNRRTPHSRPESGTVPTDGEAGPE